MKKMLVALAVMFSVAFVPVSYAKTAKEGTATVTLRYMGINSVPVLALEKAGGAQSFEELGVVLSDSGKGPFNKISTRDVGLWKYEKKGPKNTKVVRYSVWTDSEGDQLYFDSTYQPQKKTNKKAFSFIGGTGKFEKMNITVTPILPSIKIKSLDEGKKFGVHKFKIQWKMR